ncbi:MAG TPA: deoxyribodipyrimidine photo-lyase, partial [Ilumatobacteraceae bacterium]|nr:deoxyribodipyrimidine photo-lyase [Ilumatobacteraceae bacterium]
MTRTAVMWFRRDLRLSDLPALAAAADRGRVVPLYVLDPAFATDTMRFAALRLALAGLQRALDGRLVVVAGDPAVEVPRLAALWNSDEVFVTREHTPYGRRRDAAVAAALTGEGVRLVGVGDHYAVTPGTVRKADGNSYAVFTPFARAWRATGWSAPAAMPDVTWAEVSSATIDALVDLFERSPGTQPVVFGSTDRRLEVADQLTRAGASAVASSTVAEARRRLAERVDA